MDPEGDDEDEDDDQVSLYSPDVLEPASNAPAVRPSVPPGQPPVLVGLGDPVTVTVTVRRPPPGRRPIKNALVVITSGARYKQERWTNRHGVASFTMLTGTEYRIRCYKDWFVPEPYEVTHIPAGAGNVNAELAEVRFYLHVDANRDGRIDRERARDEWTWGRNSYGAVVLCNMDRDDAQPAPHVDSEDDRINTRADLPDIAPLEIRRRGYAPASNNWILELSVLAGRNQYVRIFDGQRGDSRQIVGPGDNIHVLPDPHLLTVKRLGMEALQFANEDWDGLARIELRVQKNESYGEAQQKSYRSIARVRVAPWLMPGPDEDAVRVYAVSAGDNGQFLDRVRTQVAQSGAEWQTTAGNDRWMQDCMEVGFSLLPKEGTAHRVACTTRALRDGDLFDFPPTLPAREFGFCNAFADILAPSSTFDSFGNLEVTPPVKRRGDGKEFPWGRIYFGEGRLGVEFNPSVATFLRRQVVQEPFTLDTNWLAVGHVDEMMAFLHDPNGGPWKKWKLLIASPAKAYEILDNVHGSDPASIMLRNRHMELSGADQALQCTVDTFLNADTPVPNPMNTATYISGADLRTFNTVTIQDRLNGVLTALETEIDLDRDADVIPVPVIFAPVNPAWTMCGALTADMVNMLILKDRCLVPSPFGPLLHGADQFKKALADGLNDKLNNPPMLRFINDWYTYHDLEGEIHCGTNSLRRPADLDRWLQSDMTKWWTFNP
jgi:protein-arginine deiminase